MYAAVDLGSNSFRLHVGQHDGGTMRVIKSARQPIRLAAGLDAGGNLAEPVIAAALACLRDFRTILAGLPVEAVRVVATSTFRLARNSAAFLPAAEQAIGHPIEIISGEEEGRLIYMGVANALARPDEARLVIDIGGGSTELILGRGLEIERVESLGIGSVKQSLAFFVDGRIDASSYEAAILSARSHFEDGAPAFRPPAWRRAYGSSGTIRALAAVIAKNGLGNGRLNAGGLDALKRRFIELGHVSRIDMPGLRPERAGTIVGALAILAALVDELGIEEVTPVEAALRIGVMWDLHLRSTQRDRREESVRSLACRFGVDGERAERAARGALALYAQLQAQIEPRARSAGEPGDAGGRLLHWSALLHETGMAVSQTGYHKHAAYMVEHADLAGFTAREQKTMGQLILAHKGNLRKVADALRDPDFARAVLALRLAILLMHARIDAESGEFKLSMKNRIELDIKPGWAARHPTVAYWLEKEQEWWDEVGVDFSLKARP